MNDHHWQLLLNTISNTPSEILPVGFIIDSPWLPKWAGIPVVDYFTNDASWFQVNKKAVETFPEIMFLPGFWAEFGMCTEPSAFGAKCIFPQNELPHADKIIHGMSDIDRLTVPNPEKDGLAPFVLNRLRLNRSKIEDLGHKIRFAIARGPLNIASFLMGTTEFLIAFRTDTDKIHQLLKIITEYTVKWLQVQKKHFETIDGILILDDIIGFCGESDFQTFVAPYFKEIFGCLNVSVRFLHNDADGRVCAPHLADMGVNLFNFSFLHSLREMKDWTRGQVTLLGNLPPRDVLAAGTPLQISQMVHQELDKLEDTDRVIVSCGGGVPEGVSTENIQAVAESAHKYSRLNQRVRRSGRKVCSVPAYNKMPQKMVTGKEPLGGDVK